MELWNKVKQPPAGALKEIKGGRLKGYTDINPQWRYQILTEAFGQCGVGWTYEIKRTWCEPYGDEVLAFAEILLYIGDNKAVPGIGGSKLSTKETKGVYVCDEAYKMAVTDALSVACKVLGIGANVYMGKKDDSKYGTPQPSQGTSKPTPVKQSPDGGDDKLISDGNAMIQAMTSSDTQKAIELVRKHSGFEGKNGRVERDSLEQLKGKWLFKTFKNIESEYSLFVDKENSEMQIDGDSHAAFLTQENGADNPPLPTRPDGEDVPF